VLVMLIICTLLGMAAPSLRGFFVSRKTEDTASRIVSLTRLARSMAVSEGRVYRLVFDNEARSFYLVAEGAGGFQRPHTGMYKPFRTPDEVRLALQAPGAPPGRNYLEFLPDGRVEVASVRIEDMKGGAVLVRCDAPTEQFRITPAEDSS